MSFPLSLYHRLPPGIKNAVASLRGHYLNRLRYDGRTERLVEEALERESWSESRWDEWRGQRLSYLLERAATRVPYYRDLWAERRRKGDRSSWSYLENWPVLEKVELRANPRMFVADDRNLRRMFHDHTSGTTGSSLDLWMSKHVVREWYALWEARSRRWYGVSRRDRWAILGGQLVVPVAQTKQPFWVWNGGMNQLYMSSYHLSPAFIPAYLEALQKYRIKYLLGYPSAMYALAAGALKLKNRELRLEVAIANAEPLYEHQKETISEAFGCPVRETYGMAEIVAAGSECESGTMHQWPEAGLIEAATSGPDDAADIICTGLINDDMPLIRYRVGDRLKLSDAGCSCGRNLPLIAKVEGRSDDVLYTVDGRMIGRMDPVFKAGFGILEAQIIQESLRDLEVLFVPDDGFRTENLERLAHAIRQRVGDVEIDFRRVAEIPRTDRGKFRAVVCRIPKAEIAAWPGGPRAGSDQPNELRRD